MSLVKFEIDDAGLQELLHSAELKAVLEEEGRKRNPGKGYETVTVNAGQRNITKIQTATPEAYKDNLKNNTLLKAISGNRSK